MSDFVSHVGYFPFCVGYEPEFLRTYGPSIVPSYSSVLKIPLKEAMSLYWKAKKARIKFEFNYSGFNINFDPVLPPIGREQQDFSLVFDQEVPFYLTMPEKNERMDNRVCFDETKNEPFLSFSSPVSGGGTFEFYLTFFFSGFESREEYRVFLDKEKPEDVIPASSTGWWPPISVDDEVFVNLSFLATHTGEPAYSQVFFRSAPHLIPEETSGGGVFRRHSFLKIKINGIVYDVETLIDTIPALSPPNTIIELEIFNSL
jgi:hypothetical protein